MKIKIIALFMMLFQLNLFGQKKLIDIEKSDAYTTYNYPVSGVKPEDVIKLSIKDQGWANLDKIKSYKYVQELRIEKCEVTELIIDFNQFPLLQSLYTMECTFDTIIFRGNPVNFKYLYVYEKHLNNYDFLQQIGSLKEIYLADEKAIDMENLTKNLLQMNQLSSVYLSDGKINFLPESFGKLKSLSWLSLHNLDSTFDFGKAFNVIKDIEIEHLNLMYNFNNLGLSNDIRLMKKIKYLHIGNTNFETLPAEIGELTQLIELDASMGSLSTLPSSLVKLVNLKKLILMPCKFSNIPDVLFQMTWLEELEVGGEEWFPSKTELKPIRKALKKTKVNDYPE